MSYLTDRLHADLDAHQALAEPPEHVLIRTDDLAALLRELGEVTASRLEWVTMWLSAKSRRTTCPCGCGWP